jgi:hypothetical protein
LGNNWKTLVFYHLGRCFHPVEFDWIISSKCFKCSFLDIISINQTNFCLGNKQTFIYPYSIFPTVLRIYVNYHFSQVFSMHNRGRASHFHLQLKIRNTVKCFISNPFYCMLRFRINYNATFVAATLILLNMLL